MLLNNKKQKIKEADSNGWKRGLQKKERRTL